MKIKYFFVFVALFCVADAAVSKQQNCQARKKVIVGYRMLGSDECQNEAQSDEDTRCSPGHKCVAYYYCKDDGTANTDGRFLMDERKRNEAEPVNKCETLHTCCKRKDVCKPKAIATAVSVTSTAANYEHVSGFESTPADCKGIIDVCGYGNPKDECVIQPTSSEKPKCNDVFIKRETFKSGLSNPQGLLGELQTYKNKTSFAQYAQFPWMIAVLKKIKINTKTMLEYRGGGSLIHPKIVLTAAHKVAEYNAEDLIARGGEWDTLSTNEICDHVEIDVEQKIIHEDYQHDLRNFQNSIALLILKESFQLTGVINVARLPPANMNFDGQRCFATGWGKDKFGSKGYYQNFLKKVELPVVEHNACEQNLRTSRLGEDFDLHHGFLCAGGEPERDMCFGDGGGPLNCEIKAEPGVYYLAGITLAGIGCQSSHPGFYAKTSYYRDWIDSKTKELGLKLK